MVIKMLVENSSYQKHLESEHGLSLYIETDHHKILFDTGQTDMLLRNAERMQVDLSKVDIAVISHGHYDHGGGLKAFMSVNDKAKIYLSRFAFEYHYSEKEVQGMTYIGLDQSLIGHKQFVYIDDECRIDDEIILFSGVDGGRLMPKGNSRLYKRTEDGYVEDDFRHELNMIVDEDNKTVLFAGCSHKGIVNIIEHIRANDYEWPEYVFGGFHMSGNNCGTGAQADAYIEEVATYLSDTEAHFYTCHCTGIDTYSKIKGLMNSRVEYMSTGMVQELITS